MNFPEEYRHDPGGKYHSVAGDPYGAFIIPAHKAPGRRTLHIIATDGENTLWEHVSVSLRLGQKQSPTWAEMCFVKDLFWNKDQWVVQFHPAQNDYVNVHPGVLHLWRPVSTNLPTPPKACV